MKAAFMMKDSSSLSIRRASITALFTAFESWLHLKKRMKQFPPSNKESPSNSILGSLTDVTGYAYVTDFRLQNIYENGLISVNREEI
jgi:hypothetical protein